MTWLPYHSELPADLTARPALAADQAAVRDLVFAVLAEYGLAADPCATDADLGDLEGFYAGSGGCFEVLTAADGQLLGCWGLRPRRPGVAELRKMYLRPAARGRGLGRRLLARALTAALERRFYRVELETAEVLHEAVALYRSFGFGPFCAHERSTRCNLALALDLLPSPLLETNAPGPAVIEPSQQLATDADMPPACVLCFFQEVIDTLLAEGALTPIASLRSQIGAHPVYRLKRPTGDVAVLHPGVGAPLAAGLMEEAIALGARAVVACGGAGVLDGDLAVGAVLVPSAAVRDEGTSYHYLPPAREIALSPAAVRAVEAILGARGIPYQRVKTWTTDAMYRETPERVARRRAAGCACVEMETAALAAVAAFRQVAFAQLLYAGDDLSGATWDHRGWASRAGAREQLLALAAEVAPALLAG